MVVVTVLCTGCVSTDLVQTMMKDIDRLKAQNASLRQDVNALSLEVEALKEHSEEELGIEDTGSTEESVTEDPVDVDSVVEEVEVVEIGRASCRERV